MLLQKFFLRHTGMVWYGFEPTKEMPRRHDVSDFNKIRQCAAELLIIQSILTARFSGAGVLGPLSSRSWGGGATCIKFGEEIWLSLAFSTLPLDFKYIASFRNRALNWIVVNNRGQISHF